MRLKLYTINPPKFFFITKITTDISPHVSPLCCIYGNPSKLYKGKTIKRTDSIPVTTITRITAKAMLAPSYHPSSTP